MTNKRTKAEPRVRIKRKQMIKLIIVPVVMFGFGFALVPLYSAFCAVTGINGKTGRVEAAMVDPAKIDKSRTITVKFLANPSTGLAWDFEPVTHDMDVHPGQIYNAMYRVKSHSKKETVGQAIPSLSPGLASLYFKKTQCFCFSQQVLKPMEERDMPLQFVINPDIPKDIVEVDLSYTFFNITKSKD